MSPDIVFGAESFGDTQSEGNQLDNERAQLRAFLGSIPGVSHYTDMLIENEVTVDTLAYFSDDDYKELGLPMGCLIKMKAQLQKPPWCNIVRRSTESTGAGAVR